MMSVKVKFFIYIFLTSCVILFGCSPRYSTVMSHYQQAKLYCQSIDEFSYEAINLGDSRVFELNQESPAYNFDTGKSFFKAFSMPKYTYPYRISVHSYMQGMYIEYVHIFIPRVIFLNEKYEVTRVTETSILKSRKPALSETSGLRFKLEGDIDVSSKNSNEKYFIVMTTEELLKGKTVFPIMQTVPILIVPYPIIPVPIGEKDTLVPNSPFGKIKIELN